MINKLIENGRLINERSENYHNQEDAPFSYYKSRFKVDGRKYNAIIHIKNVLTGDRYHYHSLEKIEVSPAYGNTAIKDRSYKETEPTPKLNISHFENKSQEESHIINTKNEEAATSHGDASRENPQSRLPTYGGFTTSYIGDRKRERAQRSLFSL